MTLKIDERTREDGSLAGVFLAVEEGGLVVVVEDERLPLPEGALAAVMARFGGPLEPSEALAPVAQLELGDGKVLRHARHLARYDVIARDFLVYDVAGAEPTCALATTVAGALVHLGRAGARR